MIWTFADYEELRKMVPRGDAALQWLVVDSIDAARDWLIRIGATLGPTERFIDHGRGQPSDPVEVIEVLRRRFLSLGGCLRLNCALDSLILDGNKVCGARVLCRGNIEEPGSDGVVLATGGFQGNPDLLLRYVLERPENLVLRANPWSTGDGFVAATTAGAAVSFGLNGFYGHALPAPPARFDAREFGDVSQYYGNHALALNLNGERFADESEETGEEAVNQWLARQPKGIGVYIVDDSIMEIKPLQGRDVITRSVKAGASTVTAASLADLCEKLAQFGMPPERALKNIEQFNFAASGEDSRNLRPPRKRRCVPLLKPPCTAILVQSGITFTNGGILVDERLRVLRRSGSTSPLAPAPVSMNFASSEGPEQSIGNDFRAVPIQGLFAAGADVGNISNFGYVGGLATALTTGRIAGQDATRPALKSFYHSVNECGRLIVHVKGTGKMPYLNRGEKS